MRMLAFLLALPLLFTTASAQENDPPSKKESRKPYRFFSKPVDIWRAGRTYESVKPVSLEQSPKGAGSLLIRETIWAEPVKLPDGRYTLYVPPQPVLQFLENPTPESARAYLQWQEERASKLRKALQLLAKVKEDLARERRLMQDKELKKSTNLAKKKFTLTYFHSET